MEVKFISKINIRGTMDTMVPGDSYVFTDETRGGVQLRQLASILGRDGRRFRVNRISPFEYKVTCYE